MGTGYFLGVKSGRSVTLTPHHPSSAVVKKGWSYISTPPMGRTACTEPQCLYKGALMTIIYLVFWKVPLSISDDPDISTIKVDQ